MILFDIDALAASGAGLMGTWLNRNRLESTRDDIYTICSLNELHGADSYLAEHTEPQRNIQL